MPAISLPPPWAVHISDGVLAWPWLLGGFVLAAFLALLGAWRIRDEEIAQVALLTAAFFVASSVHVRVPSTSVHLLLNSLVGVILGQRAALAIPVGLFMQAALLGHGGFTTLGINSCVMVLPALLCWQVFRLLQRVAWVRRPWFRIGLVALSTVAWTLSLVYVVILLIAASQAAWMLERLDEALLSLISFQSSAPSTPTEWANYLTLNPLCLVATLGLAALAVWAERRMENAPEFPIGLLVGEIGVLATLLLNAIALGWGGHEDWHVLAQLVFVAHLPIAVVEGIVLGFTVGFLIRVKPEMVRWNPPEKAECPVETLP
jgi:cobalt/nickel transport system permease protein